MTLFPVFSRRVAYALEAQGFKVYYFEETLALRRAAQELIQEIKNS